MRRGRAARPCLPYVPLDEAAGVPNIMADGAPIPSTVLSLSHWPASPTPPPLDHDLSAGIALRYLRSSKRWPEAAVTADHFDADGLVTMLLLTEPEWADRDVELLRVAEAGDFVRATTRDAARVAWAIEDLAAGWEGRGHRNPALAGDLHRAGLELLRGMMEHPTAFRSRWEEQDAQLNAAEAALVRGAVELSEVAPLDLAVVELREQGAPWHRMAVHNRTDRMRVLVLEPPHYQLYLRYETWVRLARRRRPPLRPDLSALASRLTALEPAGVGWRFDGAASIAPRLAPYGGGSDLPPDVVRAAVTAGLAAAPPGWDPYVRR
jgi:hypothetical protein